MCLLLGLSNNGLTYRSPLPSLDAHTLSTPKFSCVGQILQIVLCYAITCQIINSPTLTMGLGILFLVDWKFSLIKPNPFILGLTAGRFGMDLGPR